MKIKQFVNNYRKISTDGLKNKYIRENLKIIDYISFIKKDVLAQNLVDASTYKYEDYIKEDGSVGRRKTDIISVNSVAQYILFCRIVIENYTNLEVETEGFFEEYDALKQSGLLDILMVGDELNDSLIPAEEINELRSIVNMKQQDAMTNYATPQSYISNQVERFSNLLGITLKPVIEKISNQIENMTEEDMDKFVNKFEKIAKRIK